jgi:hypothetical protein
MSFFRTITNAYFYSHDFVVKLDRKCNNDNNDYNENNENNDNNDNSNTWSNCRCHTYLRIYPHLFLKSRPQPGWPDWAIVYFGKIFCKLLTKPWFANTLFHSKSYICVNFGIIWGLHYGHFFHKLIWSPWPQQILVHATGTFVDLD